MGKSTRNSAKAKRWTTIDETSFKASGGANIIIFGHKQMHGTEGSMAELADEKVLLYRDENGDTQEVQHHATHDTVNGDECIDQGEYVYTDEAEDEETDDAAADADNPVIATKKAFGAQGTSKEAVKNTITTIKNPLGGQKTNDVAATGKPVIATKMALGSQGARAAADKSVITTKKRKAVAPQEPKKKRASGGMPVGAIQSLAITSVAKSETPNVLRKMLVKSVENAVAKSKSPGPETQLQWLEKAPGRWSTPLTTQSRNRVFQARYSQWPCNHLRPHHDADGGKILKVTRQCWFSIHTECRSTTWILTTLSSQRHSQANWLCAREVVRTRRKFLKADHSFIDTNPSQYASPPSRHQNGLLPLSDPQRVSRPSMIVHPRKPGTTTQIPVD